MSARPVVEQHHDAGQAGVEVLPDHQFPDPGAGPPMNLAQFVADDVLAQRVEGDRPVRYAIEAAVQTARHTSGYRHDRVDAGVHPDHRGRAVRPGQGDQAEHVLTGDPQWTDRHHPAPLGRHRIGELRGPTRTQSQQRHGQLPAAAAVRGDQAGGTKSAARPDGEPHRGVVAAGHPVGIGVARHVEAWPPQRVHDGAEQRHRADHAEHRQLGIAEPEADGQENGGADEQPKAACGENHRRGVG